jgi:hypothetical protein
MDDFHRRQERETAISAAQAAVAGKPHSLSGVRVPSASGIGKTSHI